MKSAKAELCAGVPAGVTTTSASGHKGQCASGQVAPNGVGQWPRAIRTLVVDDSPIILKMLGKLLAMEGDFQLVGTAMDGYHAVRSAAELEPDVVLMDLRLPGLNGLEATRRIKAHRPGLTVIMVTADDTREFRAAASAAGADGFVGKNEVFNRLVATVRARLRNHADHSRAHRPAVR